MNPLKSRSSVRYLDYHCFIFGEKLEVMEEAQVSFKSWKTCQGLLDNYNYLGTQSRSVAN
jgi:hypothetical protein